MFEDQGSIFSNGRLMQLAGLAVMQGAPVSDAISTAMQQDALATRQQYQNEEMQYKRAGQQALRNPQALIEATKDMPPDQAYLYLISNNIPEDVAKQIASLSQSAKEQQMLMNMAGMGGGDASPSGSPATVGAAASQDAAPSGNPMAPYILKNSGNPIMAGMGEAMLEQKKQGREDKKDASKNYFDVKNQYDKIAEPYITALTDFEQAKDLAKQGTGFSDYQLIKMGVQAFDKRASAVTDDEFSTMSQTGALADKTGGIVGKFVSGDKLTNNQRAELVKSIMIRRNEMGKELNRVNEEFGNTAKKFGVESDFVYKPKANSAAIATHPNLGEITEDDIQTTMTKHGMTREQVIMKLGIQ